MTEPSQDDINRAGRILKNVGMRLMELEEGTTVGLWSDLDGPHVRWALRVFGSDILPLVYLDGRQAPMRYKARRMLGDPVPLTVLAAMEEAQAKLALAGDAGLPEKQTPWQVRDMLLRSMNYREIPGQ